MTTEGADADTFPKLLLRNSARYGEHPAFREKNRGIWRALTWRELADEAALVAAALSARGLKRGAHVALIGDNRPRLYAAMCAAQWLGAIAVPLYQDATAAELIAPIQTAQVTHVFAENQEQVDKLLEILPQCPTINCIVYDKDRGMRHYKQPQLVSYHELLSEGRKLTAAKRDYLQAEAVRGGSQDTAFLFFTSGTTGPAKGVVLTHGSLIERAKVAAAIDGLTHTDVAMAYLPPGWLGQNLFSYVQPMVAGYCVCCPESSDTVLADMREMGPSYFLATPSVLDALISQLSIRQEDAGWFSRALYRRGMAAAQRISARSAAGEPVSVSDRLVSLLCEPLIFSPLRDILGLSKVRTAYIAGDAIDPAVLVFFRALGINLKQLYGSTETGFFVAMHRNGDIRPDTVGRAADGVELKFTPQREILVRSPGLFKEYYRNPEATKQARNAEGWFQTGDIGYLDEDGQLRIVDRKDYVGSLSDGTPYTPTLLENKLKFFPYIKEVVAFGNRRDRVCVLVGINFAVVSRWADKQGISYTGHADLASRDEVYALIADCIAEVNTALALEPTLAKSQINRFAVLHTELNADDGMLTRTGKLRRDVITNRYRPVVEAMYAGSPEVRVDIKDGSQGDAGATSVVLKIRDAKASAQPRRAA